MTWNHPALAGRALDEGDAELRKLKAENVRLRAALKLVDNYWTSGVSEGAQPPWKEVREALAHEQAAPAIAATGKLCEDCPPVGYSTDKTRCDPCPRKSGAKPPQDR